MQTKITTFQNGQILIQDTDIMKSFNDGKNIEVVVREYITTRPQLKEIIKYIENLDKKQEQEKKESEKQKVKEKK